MTFLIRPGTPRYEEQLRARAFEAWRTASSLVHARWDRYNEAERSARAAAYTAYLEALDHEADAAAGLESLTRLPLAQAA